MRSPSALPLATPTLDLPRPLKRARLYGLPASPEEQWADSLHAARHLDEWLRCNVLKLPFIVGRRRIQWMCELALLDSDRMEVEGGPNALGLG